MRQRVCGGVTHHGVQMRQRGIDAFDLGEQVGKLHMHVEQVVGDEHRSFAFGGEHAVVDDAFRI